MAIRLSAPWLTLSLLLPTMAHAQDPPPAYKSARYDEDYRYLRDPQRRSDPWDPIKYIPLGDNPATYLSFGGELRERAEYYSAPGFGIRGETSDAYLLHRLLLSADLHVTDRFRLFVQLGNQLEEGKHRPLGPTDVDRLDWQQAFFDLKLPLSKTHDPTLRVGRQEMPFGSQRLVSSREPPNVRRSFDGVRLFDTFGRTRVDVFAVRPVQLKEGTFDDRHNDAQAFWGIYATRPLSKGTGLDLYYMGFNNELARYGGVPGSEHRQTLGTRLFGTRDGWDWNFEGVVQFGDFADQDIRAWTFASDTGFTFGDVRWNPRLGIKADVVSGDHDPDDTKLGTFNPLFPKLGYFSEASLISPNNVIDFQPSVTFEPSPEISITIGWDALWRQTVNDAVYTGASVPFPGTAGRGGRYIGNQASIDIDWQPDRHVELKASYVYFNVGDALRVAGGRDTNFAMFSVAYKF